MYGKTHSDENKRAQGLRAIKQFKGKTYEKQFGKNRATKLKKDRSKIMINVRKLNPHNGKKNPRYDPTVYSFFNLLSGELLTCTRWVFYNCYWLRKSAVCEMINKGETYHNWCVLFN